MTATHTITYKEVMEIGFVRKEQSDSIFRDQHGYDWFLVQKKLAKGFYLSWDCEERTVELVRWNPKTGDILGRLPMFSVDEIKEMIEFFRKK